jgi:hypothetical protein
MFCNAPHPILNIDFCFREVYEKVNRDYSLSILLVNPDNFFLESIRKQKSSI